MEKRSLFLIIFSIIGLIAISVMDTYKISELLQWVVLICYLVVVFITMYLPSKKEKEEKKKKKENKEEIKTKKEDTIKKTPSKKKTTKSNKSTKK